MFPLRKADWMPLHNLCLQRYEVKRYGDGVGGYSATLQSGLLGHLPRLQKHLVFNEVRRRAKNSQIPLDWATALPSSAHWGCCLSLVHSSHTQPACMFASSPPSHSIHLLVAWEHFVLTVARCCTEASSDHVYRDNTRPEYVHWDDEFDVWILGSESLFLF